MNPDLSSFILAGQLRIGSGCQLATDLVLEIDAGGVLVIGENVTVRRGVTMIVGPGATVVIDDGVAVGEHVFIGSMVGIYVGRNAGVSNMADLHDHNHRPRSHGLVESVLDPVWASGFVAAPIWIEDGALISNKVTVLGGVRIGANAIVGANAVASRSIEANSMAAGGPAHVVKRFDGVVDGVRSLAATDIPVFGTSLMEHMQARSAELDPQWPLAPVGEQVTVTAHERRGYIYQLRLMLESEFPFANIQFVNLAEGGSNSRDVLKQVQGYSDSAPRPGAFALLGCGTNDVWRKYQNRLDDAVSLPEYEANLSKCLTLIEGLGLRCVLVGEVPVGGIGQAAEINNELREYTRSASHLARGRGHLYVDVWDAFTRCITARGSRDTPDGDDLWTDGVHLGEAGDAVLLNEVYKTIAKHELLPMRVDWPLLERHAAVDRYSYLFSDFRRPADTD
jgi:acetyltransferase-like isoleucine patch superfamily enzyme/lysophospholipase L1-like esterase